METRHFLAAITYAMLINICKTEVDRSSMQSNATDEYNCCPGDNRLVKTQCLLTDPETNATSLTQLTQDCPYGMYILDSAVGETFKIDVHSGDLNVEDGKHFVQRGSYCVTQRNVLEESYGGTNIFSEVKMEKVALICFPELAEETFLTYTVTGILIFVSIIFLILTLIVYATVPKLRDLQGKCTMITAFCLCVGFIHLGYSQLFLESASNMCVFNGYSTFFWMLTTFFWMNVVAINVMQSVVFRKNGWSDRKNLIAYNVYAFGVPLLFLIAAIVAHHTEGDHLKPGIGGNSCWFSGETETWGYFYGPISVLLLCNIFIFVFTSIKLWQQTSYENVSRVRSMKYKFVLYLKLFIVMGLSWIFEIASFVAGDKMIFWVITDMFNCLQGVVFFLVLVVFRKRALRGLSERGLRIPCIKSPGQNGYDDEECDEIVGEEQAPAMTIEA